MKVNNIQSYNQSNYNQNFTAMRFRSGSTKYVSSLPNNILNKLDEIGKFLADTQYYHFDIADNFYISHINGDRLYPPFNLDVAGKDIFIRARCGFTPVSKRLRFQKESQAREVAQNIKQSATQIERTSLIVKYLDDYEVKLAGRRDVVEIKPEDSREVKIDKLIKKYSI